MVSKFRLLSTRRYNASMASALRLNPQQREAVEHGEGPLLIIAGPGSGKTRVITERIVLILGAGGGLSTPGDASVRPEDILSLTYTDKAAEEMKRRVCRALPHLETTPHISTFHSFCYQVLRRHHFERTLLDKVDVWIFLRRRMEMLELEFYRKLAEPGAFLHALNEFFSRCQDELMEPEDFAKYVAEIEKEFLARAPRLDPAERKLEQEELQKQQELARVFRNSRKLIEDAGASSLGSLIPETVRLFDREPEVAQYYRDRFRFVLVDEFQDTNYAQVELLRRLVKPPFNITAVGDDDQAIYRFRGASHGAFKMFGEAFPGHATVYLNRNYRSTKRILRVADATIARNTDRYKLKPKLETQKSEGDRVFLLLSADYLSEANWIAEEIERLRKSGRPLGEIAVLYRAHSYRDPLVRELRRRAIPFAIRGLSLLSTILLRDLLAYLNVIHSPHDNISLTRLLLMPRWQFPEDLALEVRKEASRKRCSLFDVLESWEKALVQSRLAGTGWTELRGVLAELRKLSQRAPMTALLDGLLDRLRITFTPGRPDESYVNAFREFLKAWEGKSETRKLDEFIEYFQYFREAGGSMEAPQPSNASEAVQMMTVHAAKGLEFPVVFVLSVAPRRFPHTEQKPVIEFPEELRRGPRPPEDIHEQEERRLFYVALTRAQERLYISSVAKTEKKVSTFVKELSENPALVARDLEKIEVPDVTVEPVAATPDVSQRPAAPAPIGQRKDAPANAGPLQGNLFGDAALPAALHPMLLEWASRSSVSAGTDGKLRLSASAIETYEDCPLKFKFSHYLRIPTGPQPALTFGSIMHLCVRHYFELRKRGAARFEDVEEFYLRSWKDAGFEDEYQEQAYKKSGLEQLREFVKKQGEIAVLPLGMETHFALDLGEITLEGRIDQINPLGERTVELIDYKTGRPPSQRDADHSLQLSVYALAAREQMKLTPARLTLYSLANNAPVSTVRTPKDLDEVRVRVCEVAEQIRQQCFSPKPGFACKYCDYALICPAHEEEY